MPATRLRQPAELDDLLLYKLSRLLSVGGSLVIRLCEGRFGITRREWRVIARLAREPDLLSSSLAERIQLDRARTSRAVTSLVAKKLVKRETGAADRRQARLALTPSGMALYQELFPLVCDINRGLLAPLTALEVQQLDAGLAAMQRRADAMVQGAVELPRADRRRGGRARLGVV
ncbi:MarR family transcriptional regulator [Ramlibacter sp. XY19]|uniref:MarR family winged helix-turn-helix transcriptional regulator n=1 Tax=Ramlibacter paludis TaxID=2908000 RepID=UPI0023DCB8EC|nr:MarR family transcriptional regulator [Ramlibacter paludis]MCG2592079.1 MarR family transcriptional regulator [Ramlibacter paludis]